jgi:FkbH-like protein
LRDLFGKQATGDTDRLRAASLRSRAAVEEDLAAASSPESREALFAAMDARLRLDFRLPPAPRALELINKTNQFNLNGNRWEESAWRAWCAEPASRVVVVGYEDKFGPLGDIAVLAGEQHAEALCVRTWVMSCRAFSRRIEFATLRFAAERWGTRALRFHWRKTPRNGPLAAVLKSLMGELPEEGEIEISLTELLARMPRIHCQIAETE